MATSWDSYLADASYSAVGAYDPSGYSSYDPYQGYDPNYASAYDQAYDYADYGQQYSTYEQPAYQEYAAAPVYEEPNVYEQPAYQQSQGTTSTGRYDASQYLMENTYSTGEYAPADVWAEPGPQGAHPDHSQTGRHENRQYVGENVYSTGEYAPDDVWREPVSLPTVDQTGRPVSEYEAAMTAAPVYEATQVYDPAQAQANSYEAQQYAADNVYSTGTTSELGPTWAEPAPETATEPVPTPSSEQNALNVGTNAYGMPTRAVDESLAMRSDASDAEWEYQDTLSEIEQNPLHYNTALQYGKDEDIPILGWLGDRAEDLEPVVSAIQQSPVGQVVGGGLGLVGNVLGFSGDALYTGLDALRDQAQRGATGDLETTQAGIGNLFDWVEPDTPFLGGVQTAWNQTAENAGKATNLSEFIGAPIAGALGVPDDWSQVQQGDWAAAIARGEGDWYANIVNALPTEQIPAVGVAFESPMEWAAQSSPEVREQIARVHANAEAAEPGSGGRAVWEFYQGQRNMAQRAVADAVSSPYNAIIPARIGTTTATGLARAAQSSTNPMIRAAGRAAEPALNFVGTTLGIAEAAEDLGATSLLGAAGRGLRQTRWGRTLTKPFDLTERAQAEKNISDRQDVIDSTRNVFVAEDMPGLGGSPPPGSTVPPPPGGGPSSGIRSDEFTAENTTRRREGAWTLHQHNETGQVIITPSDQSRVITPHPLTMEQAESVLAELKAGAREEMAAAWGERMRNGLTAADTDGITIDTPPQGDRRSVMPLAELNNEVNLVGDTNDPNWYWLEDAATGEQYVDEAGNPLGRMSADEVDARIQEMAVRGSAPAADLPEPPRVTEQPTTLVDHLGRPLASTQGADAAQDQIVRGLTPEQADARILGPDGELLPTTQRNVPGTGEPAASPGMQRTPGAPDPGDPNFQPRSDVPYTEEVVEWDPFGDGVARPTQAIDGERLLVVAETGTDGVTRYPVYDLRNGTRKVLPGTEQNTSRSVSIRQAQDALDPSVPFNGLPNEPIDPRLVDAPRMPTGRTTPGGRDIRTAKVTISSRTGQYDPRSAIFYDVGGYIVRERPLADLSSEYDIFRPGETEAVGTYSKRADAFAAVDNLIAGGTPSPGTPSPGIRRTPGIEGDVPRGGVRTTVPDADLQPGRATQQPTPPDGDGIRAALHENANELERLRRAAETGQPVEMPSEPLSGPTARQTAPEGVARQTPPEQAATAPQRPQTARERRVAQTNREAGRRQAQPVNPGDQPGPDLPSQYATTPNTVLRERFSNPRSGSPRRHFDIRVIEPNGQARPPNEAEMRAVYDQMFDMTESEFLGAEAAAWRGQMYGKIMRKSPATNPRDVRGADAYNAYADLMAHRVRTADDPGKVVRSLREPGVSSKVSQEVVDDIVQRSGLDPETLQPSASTLDPTANPVNRLGFVTPGPTEVASAGMARGQRLRDAMARPSNVARTAGQAPTSTERYRNLGLSSHEVDMLDTPMTKVAEDKTLGDLFFEATDELDEAVQLANTTTPLAKAQQKRLDDLAAKYNTTVDALRGLDWDGQSALVDAKLERDLLDQFMPPPGKPSVWTQRYGPFWSETKQFLRSFALYNRLTVPRYYITNAIGNPMLSVFRPSMWFQPGGLFSPSNWMEIHRRVYNEGIGKAAPDNTAYGNVTRALGYQPSRDVVGAVTKDQLDQLWGAKATGAKGKISKALMSKRGYLFAQGVDQGWREIAAMLPAQEQLPRMVREIRQSAKDSAQRMGVLVSDAQIDAAIDGLVEAAQRNKNNWGLPAFSATDLKKALGDLEVRGGANPANWVDRVHRDWRQATSKLMKDMNASADEWAFSFRRTNIDEVLGNFVTFHVWASRASKKYATEMLRNPHLLAAYVRATEGLERMAEEEGWPDSVKGFIKLIDSWGGWTGFIEPNFFMPAMLMKADQVYREEGEYGLTALGHVINQVNQVFPIIPVWRAFTYYTGLEGGGNLPPNPFYSWQDAAGAVMNQANHWLAKAGIRQGQDAGLLPAPVQQAQNAIAHRVSGWFDELLGDPDWIKQVPLESQEWLRDDYRQRQALADVVAEQYPDLPADEQARMIDEAMAEPDGDLYQEAYARRNAADTAQAVIRSFVPVQARIRNEASDERAVTKREGTPAEQDAAWDIDNAVRRAGPEDAAFEAAIDEYYAARDDLGHDLADSYFRIIDGRIPNTFKVNGREYTRWDLEQMTESQRFDLADEWMAAMGGQLGIDAQARMDSRYDAQNAILAANPDLAGAVEFERRAEEYPTGIDQFIEDTAAINAPYRQHLGTIQAEPGTDEYRDKATNWQAAQMAQGIARDTFNPIQDDTGAGRVAGLPEEITLGVAHQQRQQARQAERDEKAQERADRDAEFEEGSEYIQDARRDLPKFGSIKQRIDAYDPSGGQWQVYLDRVSGNKDAYLDDPLYESLLDEFDGSIWPSGGAEEYIIWADAQPAGVDLSFDAWREADRAAYLAEQDQIAAENANFDPASLVGGVSQPLVTPIDEAAAARDAGVLFTPQGTPYAEVSGQSSGVAQQGELVPDSVYRDLAVGDALRRGQRSGGVPLTMVSVPTGNFHSRNGATPRGIVYHITDDLDTQNVINWFQNPTSGASAHYVIDRDGTIINMVDPNNAAWTQGEVNQPRTDIPWLNEGIASGRNVNDFTLGIEFVAGRGGAITQEQIDAGIGLTQQLSAQYGIPIDDQHIIGHNAIDSINRPYDPGPQFPMQQMITSAGQPSRLGYTSNTLAVPASATAAPQDDTLSSALLADAQQFAASDAVAMGQDVNGDGVADFDSSSLVHLIARNAGVEIPVTTQEQWGEAWTGSPGAGRKLDPNEPLVPGDLVFFDSGMIGDDGQLHAEHVSIFLGNGLIIQAVNPDRGVIVSPLRDFEGQYLGARRVFAP